MYISVHLKSIIILIGILWLVIIADLLEKVLLFWNAALFDWMDKALEKQMGLPIELTVVNDRVDCGVPFIQDVNE